MQQTTQRPLIAEIEQLRRSVDSMNSQTAEMLKNLEQLRHLGADHIALPSTEQEKLDREWEYFETVCDQVYFILENAKYKLKRQQNIYNQQLNPPAPEPVSVVPQQEPPVAHAVTTPITNATPQLSAGTTPTGVTGVTGTPSLAPAAAITAAITATAAAAAAPMHLASPSPAAIGLTPQNDNSPLDLQMLSPPSNFDINSSTPGGNGVVTTPSMLLSTAAQDTDLGGDPSLDPSLDTDGADILQDTMLDLGDIGSLGNGDMDDMINF
ncbi:hypothetical protein BGZ95_005603 [Linnemannia exigua]|uniref:Uncharacterized protein n=1 Tax=Linnemannia exigua TaxID=604196 RepID=A0AAD4D232_9FUNG|nr:hypothetical protein BGZ95_005603 [Linnemannia exigua]